MSFVKKLIPKPILKFIRPVYHGVLAWAANFYYGRPSEKMVVIGITGTVGKSTTTAMLAHVLNQSGKKTGYVTTVNYFDGNTDYINKHGLSMPGGRVLQKQLKQMVDSGCKYAIVECTSEGLAQNRHWGINFDAALLTNISMAHIEAHGGFANYKNSKRKLFKALAESSGKSFTKKIAGVDIDSPYTEEFLNIPGVTKFTISFFGKTMQGAQTYAAKILQEGEFLDFSLNNENFHINMVGSFNAYNAALAASCAHMFGVDLKYSAEILRSFSGIPGRMEKIENNLGAKIFVDYGCEPASFKAAIEAAAALPHNKLIHVFGSTGGHRDTSKRFLFGKTSAQFADHIIITNDDIYDSDPMDIARGIEEGIMNYEPRRRQYEIILDRKEAIKKALSIAQKGDLILITGKGSEQFLVLPGNKRIEWDDREVVREELQSFN